MFIVSLAQQGPDLVQVEVLVAGLVASCTSRMLPLRSMNTVVGMPWTL